MCIVCRILHGEKKEVKIDIGRTNENTGFFCFCFLHKETVLMYLLFIFKRERVKKKYLCDIKIENLTNRLSLGNKYPMFIMERTFQIK